MRRAWFPLMIWLAGACDSVTSENLQIWKGTQKGPAKIEAALRNPKVASALRAEAALAMVESGRGEAADAALAAMPAGERWDVLKALVPRLAEIVKTAPPPLSREARDSLFSGRDGSPPELQAQIDAALLPSVEADLRAGRGSGGRHSIDKILGAMGPAAAPVLVRLLEDDGVPFAAVADVLDRIGVDEVRERGGAALVKRAAGMKEVPIQMWLALGRIGGRAVTDFLIAKIKVGEGPSAVAAAQALQQRRFVEALPAALAVAADRNAANGLRDEMFGVIEKIGGVDAWRGVVKIIATDPKPMVRFRAFEAALAAGKADAVVAALEAFPTGASYERADVVDFLAKDIVKLGESGRAAAVEALGSRSPLARLAAVVALESVGRAADADAVSRLAKDGGSVKKFGATVGQEATRVAAKLRSKAG